MLEFISKDNIDLTNKIEFYFVDRLIKCFENKRERDITCISRLSFNVDIECIAFEDESDTNKAMCFEKRRVLCFIFTKCSRNIFEKMKALRFDTAIKSKLEKVQGVSLSSKFPFAHWMDRK